MKFNGQPNLYVRVSNKYVQRATGIKGFFFNENGEYETENPVMIKMLVQCFDVIKESTEEVTEMQEEVTEIKEEKNTFKCKKCNFETTESMGVLLAHYRTSHKK